MTTLLSHRARRVTLVALIAVFALGGVVLIVKKNDHVDAKRAGDEQYWHGRIAAVGGQKAYREFASAVSSNTPDIQHKFAHVFGGALFDTEGVAGLPVCDARFSYGCFHEFLGRAIAAKGLSVVATLSEGCTKTLGQNALSCRHGIGHGILASIGYSRPDLDEALSVCAQTGAHDPIGGCFGGVFMEYDLRIMLGDAATIRQNDDLYDPCDSLGNEYIRACVFSQPQWWHQSRFPGIATPDVFAAMGTYCMHWKKNDTLVRTCFEGLGTIAAPNAKDVPEDAAKLCDAAAAGNALRALYCRSYAANAIGLDRGVEQGLAVCADLAADARSFCEDYARNHANILKALPEPAI